MKRFEFIFDIKVNSFKSRLLNYISAFDSFSFLDSNVHAGNQDKGYSAIAFAGVLSCSTAKLSDTNAYIDSCSDWLYGYMEYDLKNQTEHLSSSHADKFNLQPICFMQPEWVIIIDGNSCVLQLIKDDKSAAEKLFEFISATDELPDPGNASPVFCPAITKEQYVNAVKRIQDKIQMGEAYEVNYCFEFTAEFKHNHPASFFYKLNNEIRNPFSGILKTKDFYLFSMSPERFIKKTGNKLITQPIKGTRKRGFSSAEDEQLISSMKKSAKEVSENIMIVDLVRNDLAKIAAPNSVIVDELCGISIFEKVIQMVSTVSCKLKKNISFSEIITAMFPMGSMTGAPKLSAMKIIEANENFRRGIFSGSVGYIAPNGDFDFNVVIRSILYNSKSGQWVLPVGSAITALSNPDEEYEECMIKAKPLIQKQTVENAH